MSVIILGMNMPKPGTVIKIYSLGGQCYATMDDTELCHIIPLPEKHGRLVCADALETHVQFDPLGDGQYKRMEIVYKRDIDEAPTIIEAE